MKRTKIVVTIGPACQNRLPELARAGANVVRLNMAHSSFEEHAKIIGNVKKLNEKLEQPLAIILDTQGSKIRIGEVKNGVIRLDEGKKIILTSEKVVGTPDKIGVNHSDFASLVSPGDPVFLADGMIQLKAHSKSGREVECTVVSGGELTGRKGVNLPKAALKLGGMTSKDLEAISFGIEHGVDFVGVSFVRHAEDVKKVKDLLKKKGSDAQVIAKIETGEAVEGIDDIISVADAIMLARGDLGVQLPLTDVPLIQKKIISKCNYAAKPVIIATQMLESMLHNPRPTRAEVNDVANAVLDGADAVMLSEETSVGKYPVKAVETMAAIAKAAEANLAERTDFVGEVKSIARAVAKSVFIASRDLGANAILAYTTKGSTARFISRYRPARKIIGVSHSPAVVRRLQLVWGAYALQIKKPRDTDEMMTEAVKIAQKKGLVKKGDKVVLAAGIPLSVSGNTNLMKVEVVS